MKKIIWICLVIALLAACSQKPTPAPTINPRPVGQVTIMPPEPIRAFEGCAFTVNHPGNFVPEEDGQNVTFEAPSEGGVIATITVRRRNSDETNAQPQDLLYKLVEKTGATKMRPAAGGFEVKDDRGNLLGGSQTDFLINNVHYRLLVFIRPETKLPDGLMEDAVYEIIAQAPEPVWYVWSVLYRDYFNSFKPKNCE